MNKLQKQAWYCIGILLISAIVHFITGLVYGFSRLLMVEIQFLPMIIIAFGAMKYRYDSTKQGSRIMAPMAIEDERDLDIVSSALTYALGAAWLSFYFFLRIEPVFSTYSSNNTPIIELFFYFILSCWVFILVYSLTILLNRSYTTRARAEITNRKARFENKIFLLRFQHGEMTRQQLADRVGVTHQTIIDLESGEYIPSVILAMRIAGVFGVTVDQVFELNEPKKGRRQKIGGIIRAFRQSPAE
jgi:putative transcriptional regulator